jgi:hypothetical protein
LRLAAALLKAWDRTGQSHKAVLQRLQATLDEDEDPDRVNTSQWLQQNAVLEITD